MQFALTIAYPMLLHAGIVLERPALQSGAILALVFAVLWQGIVSGGKRSLLTAAAAVAVVVALHSLDLQIFFLYLPPIVFPAMLSWFLVSSLLRGESSMVTRVAEQLRGHLTAEMYVYAHGLTKFWAGLLAAMGLWGLLLAVFADERTWSFVTNILNYVLIVVAVLGEYVVRRIRFRHESHPKFSAYIRAIRDFRSP